MTHRVKEVDALARGQNLLDPGQCQELGDHRRVDGILVLPKMALFLSLKNTKDNCNYFNLDHTNFLRI